MLRQTKRNREMVQRRQMDKILRSKSYDSSSNCVYFGILVMKDLKVDVLCVK